MSSALQGSLFPEEVLKPAKPRLQAVEGAPSRVDPSERALPWDGPLPVLHPSLRVGLCSFTDPDWRGTFYREDETELLSAYAKRLHTVEVDSTFYGIPKPSVVDGWAARTPAEFRFSLKFPREITHDKMLEKVDYVTRAFLDVGARLGDKLGPFLLQFPYSFRATRFSHLAAFLEKLPTHFRYAVEVRDRSWLRQPFFQLLEDHRVALCLIDHPFWPRLERRTADFYYVRWLGDRRETPGPYTGLRRDPSTALRWWARRLKPIADAKLPIYAFAANHYAGHAPETLRRFADLFRSF